jgi:hypothetical protein
MKAISSRKRWSITTSQKKEAEASKDEARDTYFQRLEHLAVVARSLEEALKHTRSYPSAWKDSGTASSDISRERDKQQPPENVG